MPLWWHSSCRPSRSVNSIAPAFTFNCHHESKSRCVTDQSSLPNCSTRTTDMKMATGVIDSVLLIEEQLDDADLLREMLNEHGQHEIALTHVRCMTDAEACLAAHTFDIILLDLGLPDAEGLEAVRRIHAAALCVPLVVLTSLQDEPLGVQALQEGAGDFLSKGQTDPSGLLRALRYAVERKFMEQSLFAEKERAQVTLNSIGDGVICTDVAGNITFLNAVAERMTGWSAQAATGQAIGNVFRIFDPTSGEIIPDRMKLAIKQDRTV